MFLDGAHPEETKEYSPPKQTRRVPLLGCKLTMRDFFFTFLTSVI